MTSPFSIQLHQNGRTTNAKTGLDMLADRFREAQDELGIPVSREMRRFLQEQMAEIAARHGGSITTSTTLARRSGKLVAALRRAARVKDVKTLGRVTGRVKLRADRAVHEDGGRIKPTSGQYVTVPLPAALNANGTPKKARARDWPNTFMAKSRKGNLLIFQRKGGRLVPLYALKKSVTVPARLGAVRSAREAAPVFADRALSAIIDHLLED
ncbi:hypothetical protein ANTHELSMS3_03427 [Antarctobacter heliothermus]|uniref:Prophage minor tail protein Z (GPZ) n=1 Tax=Antarctobacter heliothermus TaxID=74033 RepID=A0A222E778_9RHOB|nr:hypothetical protein [Antarctobacter heliothermus]ASP22057.1 hypothetical protein ANTHELSMS3_03427 [Antarctobacter heliothermus]